MSKKATKNRDRPLPEMGLEEVLLRFAQTAPGELVEAMTRNLIKDMQEARRRIRQASGDIKSGARTKSKKDRFRL
jgi:hypothetical protein